MPEDVAPVEVVEETSTTPELPASEETEIIEEIVEAEVEKTIADICGDILERIDTLEERVAQLDARYNGQNTTPEPEGTNEPTTTRVESEPDERPRSDHFYFRRLGE